MGSLLARAGVMAAGSALLLAGCGSGPGITAVDPSASTASGSPPVGISLEAEAPVCVEAGDSALCQIGVWYVNGTPDGVTIDATSTTFRDVAGTSYSGTAGETAKEVSINAGVQAQVIWSVRIPYGSLPAEARWTAPDGTVASVRLDQAVAATDSPSPTVSTSSAAPTATPEPTTSTPTPEPTTPTPEPTTPKPTPTPTPQPTRTSTPTPKPTTAPPPSSSTPTAPGGEIG